MLIPLCWIIPMLIVRPTLKTDILKMEQPFHARYKEGNKMFYVDPTNWQGDDYEMEWNSFWKFENARFEDFLQSDLDFLKLSHKMFFLWDGNHRLQAWLPYIDRVHQDDDV